MHRSIHCAVISFAVVGCASAAPDESVRTESESALTSCSVDDPTCTETGVEFALGSFDSTTLTLTGANAQGGFSAHFTTATIFRPANLDKYTPGDPCRTFAGTYNAQTSGSFDSSVFDSIGSMATSRCTAQVWVNKTTLEIRAIRPKAP